MKIEDDIKLDFSDVLIKPQRSELKSRKEVNLEREMKFPYSTRTWKGIPIISANMDTTGTFEIAVEFNKYKMLTAIHKHYSVEDWKLFVQRYPEVVPNVMVSTGTSENDFEKITQILNLNYDIFNFICIDIANGYSSHLIDFCKKVRANFPDKIIIAGNVVTDNMTESLILEARVDVVKVGIGPGSVCTTRKMTGVGYPQLSAVAECANSAHGLQAHIISDGGCTCAGDVSKAFGGGADFVMLGGMLAGHIQSGGELITKDGKQFKRFYGMSSQEAMIKHSGGVAEYRASEGKSVDVLFRGDINNTISDILGGVRSTCTYVGAKNLKDLPKRTTFIRVRNQINNIFN